MVEHKVESFVVIVHQTCVDKMSTADNKQLHKSQNRCARALSESAVFSFCSESAISHLQYTYKMPWGSAVIYSSHL